MGLSALQSMRVESHGLAAVRRTALRFMMRRIADLRSAANVLLLAAAVLITGCQSSGGPDVSNHVAIGELGTARAIVAENLTKDRGNQRYLLDRMTLSLVTLYDGYPRVAQPHFEEVYDVLRTQGVNADKTIDSVVFYEGVKFWKGEPFEQAMAMLMYGLQQAQLGQWDNLRAASAASLFSLKDWTGEEPAITIDTDAIAERARVREAAAARGEDPDEAERRAAAADKGYAVVDSDFTLGYLMHGIASQQLGRIDEASDYFRAALKLNGGIEPVVKRLVSGRYNTVLVVGYGLGPSKEATGPDGAVEVFTPRLRSDNAPLYVTGPGEKKRQAAWVTDVNRMATSYLWRNGEDARVIKSYIGTGMTIAGAAVLAHGVDNDSAGTAAVGAGMILAGLLTKASSQADLRYVRVLPQRVYVVPLTVTEPNTKVRLQVGARGDSKLWLHGLQPPDGRRAALRYVHLPRVTWRASWVGSEQLVHGNDVTGPVQARPWPYPLGGRDARVPTPQTLNQWRAAHPGSELDRLTPTQLESAYRDAGITWDPASPEALGKHLLEGGSFLRPPMAGTTGFSRLFAQEHPPFPGSLSLPGPVGDNRAKPEPR